LIPEQKSVNLGTMKTTGINTIVAVLLFLSTTAVAAADFPGDAKAAFDGNKFGDLEKISREWLAEDKEDSTARAYLSLALAGLGRYDEAAAELTTLAAAGNPPDRDVPGIGNPLSIMINLIYQKFWANFNADANRKAWGPLFEVFPESTNMAVPASRLLMAALIKKEEAEAERIAAWFDARLEEAKDSRPVLRNLTHHYARGYLRAGNGSPRAVELAEKAFTMAWEDSEKIYADTTDSLERREKCDINSDHELWDLSLACSLGGRFDPEENLLAKREPEPGALFEDVTGEFGLGALRSGRVAAADYNGDGFVDLCFSGRLFRNEGGTAFTEVTREAGLTKTGSGALFFDYDNDGALDILVTAKPHARLFRNLGSRGKHSFEDVTAAAGLDKIAVGASPEGAAVTDIDNDGHLDFYLAAYENPYPTGHPDVLARNNGDGTFTDVSESSGIRTHGALCGRGVTCSDFDGDGDQDIHVSNYRLLVNNFWRNDGGGSFTDIAPDTTLAGVSQRGAFGHTIGSVFGDIDNDGDFDLFCANLAHPRFIMQGFSNLSMLYVRGTGDNGEITFTDERRARGIRFQETHSDPAFADYDNDGDLDLFITAIYKGAPSIFCQNDGRGFFEPVTFRSRSVTFDGWGQAWCDIDNDGDVDHVVGSGSGVRLFRNLGNANKWLKVRLRGKDRNLFGVGCRVAVTTPDGRRQVREMRVGRGTQSQDGYALHFGLGPEAKKVEVEVVWPSGHVSRPKAKVNRTLTVKCYTGYSRKR
jgi:hypothetical protein